MTSGIYKLEFQGCSAVYVGKSKNIEKRFTQHITALKAGLSSQKLLQAYHTLGPPKLVILEVCQEDELELREAWYIDKYNSVDCGFNTMYETHQSKSSLLGEKSPSAKHTNEVYVEIAIMLSQDYTIENICDTLGTTRGVVSGIKRLETHSWLKDVIPEVYNALKNKREIYLREGLSLIYQGKNIPIVVSPEGIKYAVNSVNQFAKEHELDCGGLSRLINKKAQSVKGWVLNGTDTISQKIVSPTGEVFCIPKNGITKFSKEHGLDNSILSKVLKGSVHNHRGWTKYLE